MPPPPLGRPTGSPQGTGALSLNVGDFPFAWYLRRIQAKIEETWQAPMSSREGQEAVAVFEIMRDGQIRRAAIERSSGDAVYDQAALRAITEANPFPPLPDDFREPPLRIHLGFSYRGRG
jgi:TonB family protein